MGILIRTGMGRMMLAVMGMKKTVQMAMKMVKIKEDLAAIMETEQ
jgi:hypothetical protein